MTKEYDVLAFIGRFQPFHNGHKAVVDEALLRAKKVALIIGSHDEPRTSRNPFTTAERVAMITSVYPEEVAAGRIHFCPQVDHRYNMTRWVASVQSAVMTVSQTPFNPDPVNIGLIGHAKDASSFYLKSFPTWDSVAVSNYIGLNATDIRAEFFTPNGKVRGAPLEILPFLRTFEASVDYHNVNAEYDFIKGYKKQWEHSPYPPVFFTADAVVTQAGHILLVRRGARPGKGLWAMPGGFVNRYEDSKSGMLRELVEETRLAVPAKVLRGCVRSSCLFQDPYRSERGRTITMAYHIELVGMNELPKVKGSDDADKAVWVPIDTLQRSVMFEDHYDVIHSLLGI